MDNNNDSSSDDANGPDVIELTDTYRRDLESACKFKVKSSIPASGTTGRICSGSGLDTDNGRVFVKVSQQDYATTLLLGEFQSLKQIRETNTIQVPKPIQVVNSSDGTCMLVLEYLDMTPVEQSCLSQSDVDTVMTSLGQSLAKLHLNNSKCLHFNQLKSSSIHGHRSDRGAGCLGSGRGVAQFGFHSPTCYGFFEQNNTWCSNWVEFFTRHKLQHQIDLLEKKYGDREVLSLWPLVLRRLPACFHGVAVTPALLHGDFHSGNVAHSRNGPVTFDPSSFYGHDEFDLSIAEMFGGFTEAFWDSYHSVVAKRPGFNDRKQLYDFYNLINHWNHFGAVGYWNWREKTVQIMNEIIESKK